MKILLLGASGLIGEALSLALCERGHEVLALSRTPRSNAVPGLCWLAADLAAMQSEADWLPLLVGVDAVVNCVGIFREAGSQSFAALHAAAPAALFRACARAGGLRAVQLSALGAAEDAATEYWRSKARADGVLMGLPLDWVVVRPSLVYAEDGASSRAFLAMAAGPLLLVPADAGLVQPIHLDDLTDLLLGLIERGCGKTVIAAVGPETVAWGDYLLCLRRGLGMAPTGAISIPARLMDGIARLTDRLPSSLLGRDSLAMLRQGSVADPSAISALLGRPLRQPGTFARPAQRPAAVLAAWLPMLRLSLVFVWLFTALVSACNQAESLRLLSEAGLPPALHPTALWSGVGLDALLGVLTLCLPSRRLWQAQIGLILAYSVFISFSLPAWWWHPFGPVSKNLPILALLGLLGLLVALSPARRS